MGNNFVKMIKKSLVLFLTLMTFSHASNKEIVEFKANDSFESWYEATSLTGPYKYDNTLPDLKELAKTEIGEFLREAPKSLNSQINEKGDFYRQFINLLSELKNYKKEERVSDLDELATQFFFNFYFYTQSWLIDQGKKDQQSSDSSNFTLQSDLTRAYDKFKSKFQIFQRVANHYFSILIDRKLLDPQASMGTNACQKVLVLNANKISVKIGFIKDKNGYIPVGIPIRGEETFFDVNYGERNFIGERLFPRVLLIKNGEIVRSKALCIAPYSEIYPIQIRLYNGELLSTWEPCYYLHFLAVNNLPFFKALDQEVNFKEVYTSTKMKYIYFPEGERETSAVNLDFLTDIVTSKNKTVIQMIEDASGQKIEEIIKISEEVFTQTFRSEAEENIRLEQEEIIQQVKLHAVVGKNKKKHKKNKAFESSQSIQKQEPQKPTEKDILARAKDLSDKYRATCRQKFSTFKKTLNSLFSDESGFKKIGVDLKKALSGISVKQKGSHIVLHEEGSSQTTTLIKKHGKGDTEYYPSEINGFLTNLITQILSHAFKN